MSEIEKFSREPETRREMRNEIDRLRRQGWDSTVALSGALANAYRAGILRAAEIADLRVKWADDWARKYPDEYRSCELKAREAEGIAAAIRAEVQKPQPTKELADE